MSVPDPRLRSALNQLVAAGAAEISPPAVLPARTVLEVSGESVRTRLCVFSDNTGVELAMRPDMTTPIAAMFVAGSLGEGRYAYSGDVYRLPRAGRADRVEFEQVGFEWFGEEGVQADAEAFSAAGEMASAVGADGSCARVGDVGLFHAVVDALEFSPDWSDRLKRSFARLRGPTAVLDAAMQSGDAVSGSLRLGQALSNMPSADAVRAVEEMIETAGAPVLAGRAPEEIVDRLVSRSQSRQPGGQQSAALKDYLDIRCPARDAVARISAWARESGVELGDALDVLQARLDGMARLAPDYSSRAEFDAALGRRFEYYDGFAFEFSLPGASETPFLSGGRYDGLIARMSAGKRVAAIGAAMRADRLAPRGGQA